MYNLIRIKEGEEWKTTFHTRYSHFEYLVILFGLTNAPTTYQALINNTLREYLDLFYVVYLDDILIYSKDLELYKEHVRKVLDTLKAKNLKLKLEKCEFYKTEIEFLGYIVTTQGLKMDPKKVEVVQD